MIAWNRQSRRDSLGAIHTEYQVHTAYEVLRVYLALIFPRRGRSLHEIKTVQLTLPILKPSLTFDFFFFVFSSIRESSSSMAGDTSGGKHGTLEVIRLVWGRGYTRQVPGTIELTCCCAVLALFGPTSSIKSHGGGDDTSMNKAPLAVQPTREGSALSACVFGYGQVMKCDLGELESVRAFAREFQAKHGSQLDVLVNNGEMRSGFGVINSRSALFPWRKRAALADRESSCNSSRAAAVSWCVVCSLVRWIKQPMLQIFVVFTPWLHV